MSTFFWEPQSMWHKPSSTFTSSEVSDRFVAKRVLPRYPAPLQSLHKPKYMELAYHELLNLCSSQEVSITKEQAELVERATTSANPNQNFGSSIKLAVLLHLEWNLSVIQMHQVLHRVCWNLFATLKHIVLLVSRLSGDANAKNQQGICISGNGRTTQRFYRTWQWLGD